MKYLKDETLEKYLGIVMTETPILLTQIPVEKQELLVKLLNDYITKKKYKNVSIGVIDSVDLTKELGEILANANKLFGEQDEFNQFSIAESLWTEFFAGTLDTDGPIKELIDKRQKMLKTTESKEEFLHTDYDYFGKVVLAKDKVGESKLKHATIIKNAQVIKNIALHRVVNGNFAVEGNHDENMTAKTLMTSKKKLNTYDYGLWRSLQDFHDYSSVDKKELKELLEL